MYFLPSALSLQHSSDKPLFKMSFAPLVYTWHKQILPPGFFLTFVVQLLRQEDSKYQFVLRDDDSIIQCRFIIHLAAKRSAIPGALTLLDRKTWIEIRYSSENTYCFELQQVIHNAVNGVVNMFRHTGIEYTDIGFVPRKCPCGRDNYHYCVLSVNKRVTCSESINDYEIASDMKCWIEGWYSIRDILYIMEVFIAICNQFQHSV